MYSYKKPEAEIRLHHPKYIELGLLVALLMMTQVFLLSKNFEFDIEIPILVDQELVIEDIPMTEQFRRPPPPARPSIPVEDPDTPIEENLSFIETDPGSWNIPAPPPPMAIEDEIIDFFAVERKPVLNGGVQALYTYLLDNNMYPSLALQSGTEGSVIIGFVVNSGGVPVDISILDEEPAGFGFGEVGIAAIGAMTFTPGMQRDRAVPVRMQQVIHFRLRN